MTRIVLALVVLAACSKHEPPKKMVKVENVTKGEPKDDPPAKKPHHHSHEHPHGPHPHPGMEHHHHPHPHPHLAGQNGHHHPY